jgi:hypothetical protein
VESRAVADEERPLFNGMLRKLGEEPRRLGSLSLKRGLDAIQRSGDLVQAGLVIRRHGRPALQGDNSVRQYAGLGMEQRLEPALATRAYDEVLEHFLGIARQSGRELL